MAAATPVDDPGMHMVTLEERIRLRAYELYTQRSGGHGSEVEDWLQAEEEILASELTR